MRKTDQSGASMIEMIGILGIISVVTTGILATVSKIYDRYQQSAITTQIRDLQKNIRVRFSAMSDYRDLSKGNAVEQLVKERVIPSDMVSGDKLYHAYNGEVKLSGTKYDYTIKFSDLKRNGCVDLLGLSWTVNDTSDLIRLKANGITYTWTAGGSNRLPIDLIEAGKRCDSNRTKNSIEWTFQ